MLVFGSAKFTIFLESNHRQVDDEATAQWLRWQRALRLAEPTVGVGLPGQSAGKGWGGGYFQEFCFVQHLSHEKNPGWLGYIGDYTTQLCGDYNEPL